MEEREFYQPAACLIISNKLLTAQKVATANTQVKQSKRIASSNHHQQQHHRRCSRRRRHHHHWSQKLERLKSQLTLQIFFSMCVFFFTYRAAIITLCIRVAVDNLHTTSGQKGSLQHQRIANDIELRWLIGFVLSPAFCSNLRALCAWQMLSNCVCVVYVWEW